jgi:hypothetical protein
VALRIANGHALVIERNIFADVFNDFAFIEWTGNGAFTIFGTVNVPSLPVAPAVYPLTLCAKITGDTMSFVESSPGQTGGGSAPIPSSAPATGQAGFYVGHVVPGTSTNLTHLTVGSQTPEDQHDSVCTSFLSSGMTLATTWALC